MTNQDHYEPGTLIRRRDAYKSTFMETSGKGARIVGIGGLDNWQEWKGHFALVVSHPDHEQGVTSRDIYVVTDTGDIGWVYAPYFERAFT